MGRKPTVHYDDEGNPVEKPDSKPKRIRTRRTSTRMSWKGRRSQKRRKSQKLPRSPKLQRRRALKGKRKKKNRRSLKSGVENQQCITTLRATLLRSQTQS